MVKHALVTLGLALCSPMLASAQAADTPFQMRAVTNLKTHDAIVVSNSGATAQNLCANAYALAASDGELLECCSCEVAPDALRSIPIVADLLANPKPRPKAVVLKLTATALGGGCNAGSVESLVAGLTAWKGETPFTPATLSAGEYAGLTSQCATLHPSAQICGACQPPPM